MYDLLSQRKQVDTEDQYLVNFDEKSTKDSLSINSKPKNSTDEFSKYRIIKKG